MKYKDYIAFVPGRVRLIFLALLLAAAEGLMIIGLGLSVRCLFDRALPDEDLRQAAVLCGILLAIYGLEILAQSVAVVRINRIIQDGMLNLRRHLADHAFRLPRAFYSRTDLGSLHVDWVQETSRLEMMARGTMTVLVPNLVSALTVSLFMFILHVWLSLLCWTVLALGLLAILCLRSRLQATVERTHKTDRHFSKDVLFILEMMDLIRIRNAETRVRERHWTITGESRKSMLELVRMRTVYAAVLRAMIAVMMVTLLLTGSYFVLKSKALTLGGLLAFFAVASVFRGSLNHVLAQLPLLQDGVEALRRLSHFLNVSDRAPYHGEDPCPKLLPLRIENATFGYTPSSPLMRDLDMELDAGHTLIVSGPSGAGKSTLAYLILGWFRPRDGRLTASGTPYDQLDMGALRQRVGVVLQDTWLFSGTVRENLTFGRPAIPEADIRLALRLAEADSFVPRLPHDLETQVGERGVRLSGGQKQRLAIARALLGQPELLILDEPDNHLDPNYLERLMLRLRSAMPQLCMVLITHSVVRLDGPCSKLHLAGENGIWTATPEGVENGLRVAPGGGCGTLRATAS
ncbi:MAG: ABC transporter ATP-binding protein [Kiritimatiellae bacterium]|nr:ABC transporter ATP-binding protein [Kiritimatiellia bacterium]